MEMTETPTPIETNPAAKHFHGLLVAEGQQGRAEWFTDRYAHLRDQTGCSAHAAFIIASEELISAQTSRRKSELGEAYAVIDVTRIDLEKARSLIGADEPDDIPVASSESPGPLRNHVLWGESRTEWIANQDELNLEDWI